MVRAALAGETLYRATIPFLYRNTIYISEQHFQRKFATDCHYCAQPAQSPLQIGGKVVEQARPRLALLKACAPRNFSYLFPYSLVCRPF